MRRRRSEEGRGRKEAGTLLLIIICNQRNYNPREMNKSEFLLRTTASLYFPVL